MLIKHKSGPTLFSCTLCDFTSKYENSLRRHKKRKHVECGPLILNRNKKRNNTDHSFVQLFMYEYNWAWVIFLIFNIKFHSGGVACIGCNFELAISEYSTNTNMVTTQVSVSSTYPCQMSVGTSVGSGPKLFRPEAYQAQTFFKPSVPGDLRVFRAFASLLLQPWPLVGYLPQGLQLRYWIQLNEIKYN